MKKMMIMNLKKKIVSTKQVNKNVEFLIIICFIKYFKIVN